MADEIVTQTKQENIDELPWVTLPCNTVTEKLALFAASQNPRMLKDYDDVVLSVTGWKVEPGSRIDRNTGERTLCVNTTFFTQDGDCYFTQSNGVARAMHDLRSCIPNGPRELPGGVLKLKSVKQKTVGGIEFRTIVLVFD